MYYDQNDERPYMCFVKLPQVEQKFAIGCRTLRSATVGYIVDFAKDVAIRSAFVYTEEPVVYCSDIGKIVADNTALSFCISKGYSFEVYNGLKEVVKNPKQDSRVLMSLVLSKDK